MVKTIDQLSIFVENKAGSLVQIADVIGASGVDIRAMSLADTADFGILRLIVDRPEPALEALRENGCIVSVTKVIAVEISDTPGSLSKVLALLAEHEIFIEYSYAFISRKKGNAYVIFRLQDNEKAAALLAENGIAVADKDDLDLC
ncbi:MAG: acetolactate synthase [Ruminococcaceae bacterium]|nr:acetolactate synthase [Oscillospiraceae bacterium]